VMEHGRIQQIDVPKNIYGRPANLFTAQFIGSPTINVLHGRAEAVPGGVAFRCESEGQSGSAISIPLRGGLIDKLQNLKKVVLGFRPEHLRLNLIQLNSDAHGSLQGKVDMVENAGVNSYVYVSCGTMKLVSRYTDERPPAMGDTIGLEFDVEHALLFDSETGEAIR
jgi:multiple sugar transport system ATP-binding protein